MKLFKNITILNDDFDIQKDMNVLINGKRIEYVGKDLPDNFDIDSADVFDGIGRLLMPGFINAHAHSPMTLLRGYGENLNLQDWLFTRVFPFEAKLTSKAVYWGTLLAMAESLRYGIVSTSDMYYFCDDMVRAVIESGAKANISRAVSKMDDALFDDFTAIKEMKALARDFQGAADGRIIIESSLHAEYTNTEESTIALAELTKAMGLRMHVHVSETKTEHMECKERHGGRTPVKYLADCGIFDVPSLAAHCVWVEEEDRHILREKGVTVATNTVSNLKLASGICDVKALMDEGITVALGTDSVASNNNLSMFEEMKTMSILQKVTHEDPTLITPKEALKMATVNGAVAQGRSDIGLLKEGYSADLIVLNLDSPNLHPTHDLLSSIVLSARDQDIEMTMVNGEILYQNGTFTTIDIEKTIRETEDSVNEILATLND